MFVEPKRFAERRTAHTGSTSLDRRKQPLTTTEGQLQKARDLLRWYHKHDYLERRLKVLEEYYIKNSSKLTESQKNYWKRLIQESLEHIQDKHYARARDIAEKDGLTNLYLEARFKNQVIDYIKEQPEGTFFFLDVNYLKRINDDKRLGHDFGNTLIKTFAENLREMAQKYNLTICRAGGDEFAMYSSDKEETLTNTKIKEMIDELRANFKDTWAQEGTKYPGEFAIGWVRKSKFEHITNPETLYSTMRGYADKKMYLDKENVKRGKTQ